MQPDHSLSRPGIVPTLIGMSFCCLGLIAACNTQPIAVINFSDDGKTTQLVSKSLVVVEPPEPSLTPIATLLTQSVQVSATPSMEPSPTLTPTITSIPTETPTPTLDTRPLPKYWREWPVIPTVSARAKEVFLAGQDLGNDPSVFSRIGDCQSLPEVFLGIYDTDRYWLGVNYQDLQITIDQFSGAFGQANLTARDGFSVASVFSPLLADKQFCQGGETPLECEFRIHKPIIIFISVGTNWQPGAEITFTRHLKKIIDFSINAGVIPILMTKADNVEKDNLLNQAVAQVAYDTQMPLLNTWSAVQYLPNHGLKEDGIYLTTEAWNERSFTAVIALDAIWQELAPLLPR